MKQEFTIVDLKFFKMLLNVCFKYIYPEVQETVDNPDTAPTNQQFLIHLTIAHRVCKAFFPHLPEKCIDDEKLIAETKDAPHIGLVSFWKYAEQMITEFRQTHVRFHHQVSGLLTLVGWQPLKTLTEDYFFHH